MKTVFYTSPYVPREWIEAHGFHPVRTQVGRGKGKGAAVCAMEGMCPYAESVVESLRGGGRAAAVVLTTTCDQMRRAAEVVQRDSCIPVFLMDVPCTRRLPACRRRYRMEMDRLGRFLIDLGGRAPGAARLASVVRRRQRFLASLRDSRDDMSARQYQAAVMGLHRTGRVPSARRKAIRRRRGVPLALLGGPVGPQDYWFLDAVEAFGGRVALDGTETGERTLPARIDPHLLARDPSEALACAYFDNIRDVFQRPNSGFYEWLKRETSNRGIRGVVVRTHVWCDLWRAEVDRIRETLALPLLHIDVDRGASSRAGVVSRTQAFLETLS